MQIRLWWDDTAPVAPFSYNPSSWSNRIPICLLAGVATLISIHLALYQWRLIDEPWDPVFGGQSAKVLDSEPSEVMRSWIRLPDAALGALAYLGDLIFGLAGSTKRWFGRPWLVILFGIDVIPLGAVSVVLVILQGTVVGSWCFLCLVTALISLILIVMAVDEVWSCLKYLLGVWRRGGRAQCWQAFLGKPTEAGRAVVREMTGAR
ncbi:MAG: vitamin K epoxide reductase family protein [Planctomycetota bacterium]